MKTIAKKVFAVLALAITTVASVFGQNGFSYQAVIRNAEGELVANKQIVAKFTLKHDGESYYTETQSVATNQYGNIQVVVGAGEKVDGEFANVPWNTMAIKMLVEVDLDGAGKYTALGEVPIQAAPYAMHAQKAGGVATQNANTKDGDALFAVNDASGNPVFAVFAEGIVVYVDDAADKAARRSGFVVTGRSATKDQAAAEYFAVTTEGTHIYVDDADDKAARRSGFVVTGRSATKDGEQADYLTVGGEGTTVYVDGADDKAARRSGFVVTGRSATKDGEQADYLTVGGEGTTVYVDGADDKAARRSGFVVTGRSATKDSAEQQYFAATADGTTVYVDDAADKAARRSGFVVTGRSATKDGEQADYLAVGGEGTQVFIDGADEESDKAARRSGFVVTGRSATKADETMFAIEGGFTRVYIDEEVDDKAARRSGFVVTGRSATKAPTKYMAIDRDSTNIQTTELTINEKPDIQQVQPSDTQKRKNTFSIKGGNVQVGGDVVMTGDVEKKVDVIPTDTGIELPKLDKIVDRVDTVDCSIYKPFIYGDDSDSEGYAILGVYSEGSYSVVDNTDASGNTVLLIDENGFVTKKQKNATVVVLMPEGGKQLYIRPIAATNQTISFGLIKRKATEPYQYIMVEVEVEAKAGIPYEVKTASVEGGRVIISSATALYGEKVQIEAVPNDGYTFAGWSDGATFLLKRTMTVTSDIFITASFEMDSYSVETSVNDEGMGYVDVEGSHNYGDKVTFTANPNEGYSFKNWSGESIENIEGIDLTANPLEVVLKSDLNVTANFEIITFTVTFDPQGGKVNPATVSVDYKGTIAEPKAERKGYHIVYWATNVDGKLVKFNFNDPIVSDTTIIAQWEVQPYTISYKEVDDNFASATSYTVEELPTIAEPSKEGNEFIGWTGKNWPEPTKEISFDDLAEDIELTANWAPNQHSVTFINGNETVAESTVEYGAQIEQPENNPEKEGHEFVGWNTDSNATEAAAIGQMPDDDVVYYAIWSVKSYELTWVYEGTINETIAYTMAGSVEYGTQLIAPKINRAGYELEGWEPEVTTMPAENMTYTAKWKPNTNTAYTVNIYKQDVYGKDYELVDQKSKTGTTDTDATFDAQEIEGFEVQPITSVKISGDGLAELRVKYNRLPYQALWMANGQKFAETEALYEAEIPALAEQPTLTGHSFDGWYYEVNGDEAMFEEGKLTMPLGGITFTAGFSKKYYAVNLPDAGLIIESPQDVDGKYEYEAEVTLKVTDDYELTGDITATDASGNSIVINDNNGSYTFTMPDDVVTITAELTKIYAVTFDANGGKFADGEGTMTIKVAENTAISDVPVATRDGYSVKCWLKIAGETNEEFDFSTPIASAITLKADWTPDVYTKGSLQLKDNAGRVADAMYAYYKCAAGEYLYLCHQYHIGNEDQLTSEYRNYYVVNGKIYEDDVYASKTLQLGYGVMPVPIGNVVTGYEETIENGEHSMQNLLGEYAANIPTDLDAFNALPFSSLVKKYSYFPTGGSLSEITKSTDNSYTLTGTSIKPEEIVSAEKNGNNDTCNYESSIFSEKSYYNRLTLAEIASKFDLIRNGCDIVTDYEGGTVAVSGNKTHVNYREEVTLTATAKESYIFYCWADYSLDNPRTVKVTEAALVQAIFIEPAIYVSKNGNNMNSGITRNESVPTIADALHRIPPQSDPDNWADWEIRIIGTLKGGQSIADDMNIEGIRSPIPAKSITLTGASELKDGQPQDTIDAGWEYYNTGEFDGDNEPIYAWRNVYNYAGEVPALTITAPVPVTIKNLIITRGKSMTGGGIKITYEDYDVIPDDAGVTLAENAIITNNAATNDGCAGVYINSGTLRMLDGSKISGNQAIYGGSGGGVVLENGTLDMQGGIISGNNTTSFGDDIYFSDGTLLLSGAPVIGKLYYSDGYIVLAENLTDGASITIQPNYYEEPYMWYDELYYTTLLTAESGVSVADNIDGHFDLIQPTGDSRTWFIACNDENEGILTYNCTVTANGTEYPVPRGTKMEPLAEPTKPDNVDAESEFTGWLNGDIFFDFENDYVLEDMTLTPVWAKPKTELYVNPEYTNSDSDGTSEKPFASIQDAIHDIYLYNKADYDYTIYVNGYEQNQVVIGNSLSAKTILLLGVGDNSGFDIPSYGYMPLSIETNVPVTLKNVKINVRTFVNSCVSKALAVAIGYDADVTFAEGTEINGNGINQTSDNAGVVVNGKLTMSDDAKIHGFTAGVAGGVLLENSNSVLIMEGNSSIYECSSKNSNGGGGIHMSSGQVTMNDNAIIRNCTANYYCGGVTIEGGEFVMNNESAITACRGGSNGSAGVYIKNATVTMNGGEISNNTVSERYGAGVYMGEGSKFIMKGGTISDNKGGGVYITGSSYTSYGEFDMQGGTISGNLSADGSAPWFGVHVCADVVYDNNDNKIHSGVGVLKMSGSAYVDEDNEVILCYDDEERNNTIVYEQAQITITGQLTHDGPAARIKLLDRLSSVPRYSRGKKLIDGDDYVSEYYSKFILDSDEWTIGSDGTLKRISEGTISSKFTVNAEGKQVYFSQGNLQYNMGSHTWQFAEDQCAYIGTDNENISNADYKDWIDLFSWGKGNNPTEYLSDADYSEFVDFGSNAISNGGNAQNKWRTLTKDEWDYLLTRSSMVTVGDQKVLVLTPDGFEVPGSHTLLKNKWSDPEHGSYHQLSQYEMSQLESFGAVFLPVAGYRSGDDENVYVYNVTTHGTYMSATPDNDVNAWYFDFSSDGGILTAKGARSLGYSVRLVQDVEGSGSSSGSGGSTTFHVAPGSNGNGTESAPFGSITDALAAMTDETASYTVIVDGDFSEDGEWRIEGENYESIKASNILIKGKNGNNADKLPGVYVKTEAEVTFETIHIGAMFIGAVQIDEDDYAPANVIFENGAVVENNTSIKYIDETGLNGTVELFQKGAVTLTIRQGAEIVNNDINGEYENNSCGGVYIGQYSKLVMEGGTISGNTKYDVCNSADGSVTLSGEAKAGKVYIHGDNDTNVPIIIGGELTGTGTVATICPAKYSEGDQVIVLATDDDNNNISGTSLPDVYSRFEVAEQFNAANPGKPTQWYVDSEGKLTKTDPNSTSQTVPSWMTDDGNGHYYVDLGLSTLWATTNVGADNPQDKGTAIQWSENIGGSWGTDWKAPTQQQFAELDECTMEYVDSYAGTGKKGIVVYGENNSSQSLDSPHIFIPYDADINGNYWTSEAGDESGTAKVVIFTYSEGGHGGTVSVVGASDTQSIEQAYENEHVVRLVRK